MNSLEAQCVTKSLDDGTLKYTLPVYSAQVDKVMNAVLDDAMAEGKANAFQLVIPKDQCAGTPDLRKMVEIRVRMAYNHKELRRNPFAANKGFMFTGATLAGLVGFMLPYESITEGATHVAEYMNNVSHLLAPVTGLVQSGCSIAGLFVTTALGAMSGALVGKGAGKMLNPPNTSLANRLGDYIYFRNALAVARVV